MISPNPLTSNNYEYFDGFQPNLFDAIFDHVCKKVAEWEPDGAPRGSIVFNNMDDILKVTNSIYYIHAFLDEEEME